MNTTLWAYVDTSSRSAPIRNVRAALRLVFLYEKDGTDGFDSLL